MGEECVSDGLVIPYRRLLLLSVVASVVTLAVVQGPEIGWAPFPGINQLVRLPFNIRFGGDYNVKVAMPTIGNPIDLPNEEKLPCEIAIRIEKGGTAVHSQRVAAITLFAQVGSGHVDQFRAGDSFHLGHGEYSAIFEGGACVAAANRGAMLTLDRDVSHMTERYSIASFVHTIAQVLLIGGLLGLIVAEARLGHRGRTITK